jgi:pre-rRNA-processing protein TSR2
MASTSNPEQRQAHFELGVALTLLNWPALTLAVQNNWTSSDKPTAVRDWFAGQIVTLFEDTDLEMIEVETRLLNVMEDEFEVIVDDGSAYEVAEQVCRIFRETKNDRFLEVEIMRERWQRDGEKKVKMVDRGEVDADTDGDSDDDFSEESEDEDGDVEMGDAPLKALKEKVVPEIDEDGFTKVAGKKKR